MSTYYSYYDAYTKLNDWVYHNLFETLLPNTNVIMAFHSQLHNVLEIAKQDFDIADAGFYLAKQCNSWSDLCYERHGIPQYLGLIALQVYVAVDRNDGNFNFSAQAYNPFLQEHLDGIDSNEMQRLYRGGQHKIYDYFERWCTGKGFSIYLSKDSRFCYVQYPLSLSILRKKDFDSMGFVFHQCGFTEHGDIEFDQFKKLMNNARTYWPSNIQKIWGKFDSGSDYRLAFWSQLYTAYLEWDGYYETPQGRKKKTTNTDNRHSYSIYWDQSSGKPPIFYDNNEQSMKIPHFEVFYIQDPFHTNDWQYIKDGQISKQWTDSEVPVGKLQYVFICLLNHKLTPVAQEIERIAKGERKFNSYNLFLLDSDDISSLIQKFPSRFPQATALKLVGGIKLAHSIWMYGAGPQMLCNSNQIKKVVLQNGNNNQVIAFSQNALTNLTPGIYFIKYSGEHPAVRFEIQRVTPCSRGKMCGWEIGESGFKPSSEKHDVHGLDFSGCTEFIKENILLRKQNVVRDWISQEMSDENESKSNSIITQVLRRAKNGICNRKSSFYK